ncbi:MAG TPA: DUF2975 domain-containing protein [Clostridiales bacterium]|nr:DUF2975 domain-containing protein [Clostridiales bacterium]
MTQSVLAKWLKGILLMVAACGLGIYAVGIPIFGKKLATANPEFAYCYVPWLVFLSVTAIPCFAVLVCGWKIAGNIGRDQSFSAANARYLRVAAVLAAADSVFLFAGNVVFLFLNMNHPGVLLAGMAAVLFGVAVSVAAAVLSHLVQKAAALQEQSDFTI